MKKYILCLLSAFLFSVPSGAMAEPPQTPPAVNVSAEIKNLKGKDMNKKVIAAQRLGKSRDKKARKELLKSLKAEKDPYVRSKLIDSMAGDKDPEVSAAVLQSLKKENPPDVRYSAVNALGRPGNEENRDLLIRLFLEENEELGVRLRAGGALTKFTPADEVYQCFVRGMESPVPQIRSQAVTSLSVSAFDGNKVIAELKKRSAVEKDASVKKVIEQRLKFLGVR